MKVKDGKLTFTAKLNYNWQHAYSTHASGSLSISGCGRKKAEKAAATARIIELLEDSHSSVAWNLMNEFGNKYVAIQVFKINGVQIREDMEDGMDVLSAIVQHLKEHPEERYFHFSGQIG